MASEFPQVSIGDLVDRGHARLQTGPFGSQLHKHDYTVEGIPVIPTEGIGRGRIVADAALPLISETKAGELSRHRLILGDILFARRGIQATGLSAIVDQGHVGSICGTGALLLRVDPAAVDPKFLAAYLSTAEAFDWLRSNAVGAVMPNLNTSIISRLRVPMPSMGVQASVGQFIACLDDRIDLLRQTNATLEAIAQALFKSWFVDFDPVRAKAEGREPEGMDPATAALFPSEFEESELGLIPRDWTIACLEEHVEAERGLSYKGAGLADPESGLPMHNLNSVLEGGGYKYAGIKFYKGDFKERHIAQAGDVVVANTEQGHHHRLIGFPAIVPRTFQRGLFSHHLYRVRIRDDSPITRHWIYRALMTPRVRDQIIGCANGSTVNMLKPAGLQIPRFVLPPGPLCERFEGLAVALHDRIETNVDLADSLAALRDTLLPRLISGKLLLPQAEAVEEASA